MFGSMRIVGPQIAYLVGNGCSPGCRTVSCGCSPSIRLARSDEDSAGARRSSARLKLSSQLMPYSGPIMMLKLSIGDVRGTVVLRVPLRRAKVRLDEA